jgi:UDP-glucose 4-epimerase
MTSTESQQTLRIRRTRLAEKNASRSKARELASQIAGTAVLVTGASGFIGTHLCLLLTDFGAKVHAVSRTPRRSERESMRWWQADFRDITAVRRLFKSVHPQIVFHLASYVVGARELSVVLPTFYDNLASTVHLLTVASEMGCERVVLASSSEEPQFFEGEVFARSPYAAAKWASSIYGKMFYQLFDLPVVMPRIFMTYGPNQKDVNKLVPSVVIELLRGETPKLTSGQRRADWIYVDDVVEGLLRTAIIPGLEGCAFDLGSGSLVSVREIVEQLVEIVGSSVVPAFGALPDRPFEQERPADGTFLSDKLGFRPRISLRDGLSNTVAWYRRQAVTV